MTDRVRHVPFRCPKCGEPMNVIETREREGTIWRRRTCPQKHASIQTTEEIRSAA